MSDQNNCNNDDLVPAGRYDVAPNTHTNPLVSRGIVDLVKIQELLNAGTVTLLDSIASAKAASATRQQNLQAGLAGLPSETSHHPFDVRDPANYQRSTRMLRLLLRQRRLERAAGETTQPGVEPGT